MNKITIEGQAEPDGLPSVRVNISIAMTFHTNAPAAIVAAVGSSMEEMLRAWQSDNTMQCVAHQCRVAGSQINVTRVQAEPEE